MIWGEGLPKKDMGIFDGWITSFDGVPIDSVGHHVIEVVAGHEPIVIEVGLREHDSELFLGHVFS